MKPIRRIDQANLIPLKEIQHKHLPPEYVQDTSLLTPEELKKYQTELRKQKIQSALDKVLQQIQAEPIPVDSESNPTADAALEEHLRQADSRRQALIKRYGIDQKNTYDTKAKTTDVSHSPRPNIKK